MNVWKAPKADLEKKVGPACPVCKKNMERGFIYSSTVMRWRIN